MVLCIEKFSGMTNFDNVEFMAFNKILGSHSNNQLVKDFFDKNIESIKKDLQESSLKDDLQIKSLKNLLNNDLLKYMICIYSTKKNFANEFQWIDVEDELLELIKFFNELNELNELSKRKRIYIDIPIEYNGNKQICKFCFKSLSRFLEDSLDVPTKQLKNKLFEKIFEQLEQFSSLLKFYLNLVMNYFRQKIELKFKFSSNIEEDFYFSHIISFNYTDTPTIYNLNAEVYYVNGSLNDSNVILGVENPDPSTFNKDYKDNATLLFKNVQRVLYDFKYKHNNWFESLDTDVYVEDVDRIKSPKREVYIVGHSLAFSDKQILLNIIEKADKTTIYYYCDEDKKSKIINLYKILGDEKFYRYINHCGSIKPKIYLKPQSEIIFPEKAKK